jgi:hypothetical protein
MELNTLYINVIIYSSLNMFSSTKLENRPQGTLREQRLFYSRSQISINIQSWFRLNKCSAEYNTQQQFPEESAFSCWYVELNPRLCRWVSFEKNIYRLLTFLRVYFQTSRRALLTTSSLTIIGLWRILWKMHANKIVLVLLYSHSLYCLELERHICLHYPP